MPLITDRAEEIRPLEADNALLRQSIVEEPPQNTLLSWPR
jgi:hypothetical protein